MEIYNKLTLQNKLVESLVIYSNNIEKRCKSSGGCYYGGAKLKEFTEEYNKDECLNLQVKYTPTKGCLVGRLMTKKQREWADEEMRCVLTVIKHSKRDDFKLPKLITMNGVVLDSFQSFHDSDDNWDSERGLSHDGEIQLIDLIDEFEFDKEAFNNVKGYGV